MAPAVRQSAGSVNLVFLRSAGPGRGPVFMDVGLLNDTGFRQSLSASQEYTLLRMSPNAANIISVIQPMLPPPPPPPPPGPGLFDTVGSSGGLGGWSVPAGYKSAMSC